MLYTCRPRLFFAATAIVAGTSDAAWENPLQVAARNRRRASMGGAASNGNDIGNADLDMGAEEVHQLLADLVSA